MSERDIFLAAIDLPDEAARAAYLDRACAGNPALRQKVDGLLRSHADAGSFLGVPLVAAADADHAATRAFESTDGDQAPPGATPEEALAFLAPAGRPDSFGRIGHYEVLQILGEGAFGIVYRAFDDTLKRVVAVKVLAPQLAATSPARKRFLREARTSAQVRHENVVAVHDVGEVPLPYLVMEFIPGETLQQRLDRTGPLEVSDVLRIGRQIAEGLVAAHATDLVHRDIKPGNILLDGAQQRVKITDFGLARAADDASISQSGIIAGTPMYMSPEQARGDHIDHRADLFSLGSVLYQMVAGRPPFRANSMVAVLKRVADAAPRPIREIIPETPQWLCDIIGKLHAKNPDDRFQSAREVVDLLADCETQLRTSAKLTDLSRIPRSKPAARSGRRRWVIAAAVVVPLLALGVYALTRPGPHPEPGGAGPAPPVPIAAAGGWHGWPTDAPPPALAPFDAAQAKRHQEAWARYLGVPVEYTNSVRMKFLLIPPGEYQRGSDPGEFDAALRAAGDDQNWELHVRSEVPPHKVVLTRPFYLAAHEVTQSEYGQVAGANPSYFTPAGEGKARVAGVLTSTLPVEQVSWHDVIDFCARLSRKEGLKPSYVHIDHTTTPLPSTGYRLPTEAEWEFAGRAGTTTRYTAGADDRDLLRCGWHRANSESRTQLVGQLAANPFGLHDLEGNVWEWVQDWWQPNYYAEFKDKPAIDPPGPPAGTLRGVRGGSWPNPASCCRPGHRFSFAPNRWGFLLGFRLALPVEGVRHALKQPAAAAAPEPPAFPDAEAARIAALPPDSQVEEVRKALVARNPKFDGQLSARVEDGHVVALQMKSDHVSDIWPVRGLPRLVRLEVDNADLSKTGALADLGPLRGTTITELLVRGSVITDLTPLRGLPLRDLWVSHNPITDYSVLKGLPLTSLVFGSDKLTDLSVLKGMKLTRLDVFAPKVTDLTPLTDLPLRSLSLQGTPIGDLKPIAGMRLEELSLIGTLVTDLSPVRGMPLRDVGFHASPVADLSPLKGAPLFRVNVHRTRVADLSPLTGAPLEVLHAQACEVTDLSPLKGAPLKQLWCDYKPERDAAILRTIKTLEQINGKPAAEFLKDADPK